MNRSSLMRQTAPHTLCIVLAALASVAVLGCNSGGDLVDGVFTQAEWTKIQTLSPLPPLKPDTTSMFSDNPMAAKLGQMLFFEKSHSGPIVVGNDGTNGGNGAVGQTGQIACASCHQPENYWIDRRSNPNNTALGAQWMTRNASSVLNSSYYTWQENDGVRDSQWADALTDPEDFHSQAGTRLSVAHMLYKKYKAEYDALFPNDPLPAALDPMAPDAARFPPNGDPADNGSPADPNNKAWIAAWQGMAPADQAIVDRIFVNFGKCIQAFVRQLVSQDSPFDKYVAGDTTAIDDQAKAGLELFVGKANCVGCHNGPLLSDNKFHVTGIKVTVLHADPTETGRYGAQIAMLSNEFRSDTQYSDDRAAGMTKLAGLTNPPPASLKNAWRTKGLREVSMTAPYMHEGEFATLEDVVKFYNRGGDYFPYGNKDELMKQLDLTDSEIQNIVAFLGTLTGEPVSAELSMNTAKP